MALGVLHHVPDTAAAIRSCAELLKPSAPLLLYLYYATGNRPRWLPPPAAPPQAARHRPDRPHRLLAPLPPRIPCRSRHCSLYTLRTDARDRFGTPLEQRFSRAQIRAMCSAAGLVDLRFSPRAPYWCVVGTKRRAWQGEAQLTWPHWPVLLYYKLSNEGSAWVGFGSSIFRAGSPSSSAACWR